MDIQTENSIRKKKKNVSTPVKEPLPISEYIKQDRLSINHSDIQLSFVMGENKTNDDLIKYIQAISEKCDQIRNDIVTVKQDLTKEIEKIHSETKEIKEENIILKTKLNILEQKFKKYNLIIYGLEEQEDEIEDIQKFLDTVNQNLDIDCRFDDLRDIFRIGKNTEGKIRPLLVEFVNYKLKIEILHKARLLKGTNIFVSNDYTPEEYRKQKVLRQYMSTVRAENCKAFIQKSKLYIDGREYTYEEVLRLTEERNKKERVQGQSEKKSQRELNTAKGHQPQESNQLSNSNKNKQATSVEHNNIKRRNQQNNEENPLKRFTRQKGRIEN